MVGFHDHHSNEYYFKQEGCLGKTVATLPSFGSEISAVVHVVALKSFVFFLKDRSIALVDNLWSLKLRVKGPEVIISASPTKNGELFAVGVSGLVYFVQANVLVGPKFEQIMKVGLDNWRMFIQRIEVETASG